MSSGELSLHATTPREPAARKVPLLSLKAGAKVGGYVVVSQLGVGGMGRVFLADDPGLVRKVALKILPPEDADDEGRARFLREAQALARVQHKNVVQVFASGIDEDVAWMALEYVVGDPLGALVDGNTGVDEETALSLIAQAARGLAAVHAVGVVHRDVKPDNLLLDENACVRVLDFGVALLVDGLGRGGFVTQKGVAVGTPHFMAPEQARGSGIDSRADGWGLGATLYTLLAGRPPFYARDDEPDLDILARVLRERAPDVRARAPSTSAATADLVARLLEPDADKRLADMTEVADVAEAIADALAAGTPPPAPAPAPAPEAAAPLAPIAAAPMSAPTPPPPAARVGNVGVVAIALLFAGLGALVAFQLARWLAPEPVTATLPDPPPPPTTPATTVPLPGEVPTLVQPPVDDEPARVPAPPTAEELEALFVANPQTVGPLWELIGRDDDAARAAVARLAALPGAPGEVVVDTLVQTRTRTQMPALRAALLQGDRGRAGRVIELLIALKPFEALSMLDEASTKHPDKTIRQRALAARLELFSVEGK